MATAEDKKDDLTTCSICFETFKTPKHFPCLHSFCEGCIQTYISKTFNQTQGGVHCPLCRMFVSKPDGINVEEWSMKLPTNHILVSLMVLNETKSDQKLCAACSRENETESAISWCVNCCEALCKFCNRSHRRNKTSSNHKLIELGENFAEDIPLHHADIYCTEHPEKKIKAYCTDHSVVCCMTCVMLKHRKCDNVGSIEDAAEAKKKSKEIEEFPKNLQGLKVHLEHFLENRTDNLQSVHENIIQIRADVKTIFKELSDHLNKLEINIMSDISKIEKSIKPEIESERDELKCRISALENDLALFHTNMKHAPPAQFIHAMRTLEKQKEKLEIFVKEKRQNLKEIVVTFKANDALQGVSKCIQECGEVSVSRVAKNEVERNLFPEINLLTAVPSLNAVVNTGFEVRGIALLDNGLVVLSDYNNNKLELRDTSTQCSRVVSTLSLPGTPWGVKMTSGTEGAVAVSGYGVVIFNIKNNQIIKCAEIKGDLNIDFIFQQGQYYVGYNNKVIVYKSNNQKVNDILLDYHVGYMTLCDSDSLCYTSFNNARRATLLNCVRKDGSSVFTYSNDKLDDASGVTVDHAGYIYVCCRINKNVHQLSHDGKLQRIIFDNLPSYTNCISFNTRGDKAAIGCDHKVVVYDLK